MMYNMILIEQQVTLMKVNLKIASVALETIESLGLFSIHWRRVPLSNDSQRKVSKIVELIFLDL